MIGAEREDKILIAILSIFYLIQFKKNITNIKAFLNSDSKVNTIIIIYISKLGLCICGINVEMKKIVKSSLAMFEIVIAS